MPPHSSPPPLTPTHSHGHTNTHPDPTASYNVDDMAAASDEVNRKIGVSSGVLQKFKPAEARGDNVTISYKITPDMRAQLLTLYPDLKRQHEATVPHQITESEFCTATSTSSADRLSRTSQPDVTPPTHAVCYALRDAIATTHSNHP